MQVGGETNIRSLDVGLCSCHQGVFWGVLAIVLDALLENSAVKTPSPNPCRVVIKVPACGVTVALQGEYLETPPTTKCNYLRPHTDICSEFAGQ